MSDLDRIRYFLAPAQLTLCAWATARVVQLRLRLRNPDAASRIESAPADPAARLKRRLQSRSLPRLLSELEARAGHGRRPDHLEALEQAKDLWRFLNFVLIRMLHRGDVCLLRGLVLYEFLRRRAVPVALHCGVRRSGAELSGHCWISCEGRPLFETRDPAETFQVMLSYPESGGRP